MTHNSLFIFVIHAPHGYGCWRRCVTVQHWLGHTDIKTTMKYAHFMPERLAVAADAINHRATHVSA